jgi:hypothetical protein
VIRLLPLLLLAAACASPDWTPQVGEARFVVPSPNLPAETPTMTSNNNVGLWLTDDGELLMAWRSAPTHFAGPDAVMNLVRSFDLGDSWEFEASWALGSDVREPLFYEVAGTLFFTFFQGGTDSLAFQPQQMWRSERLGEGDWSDLEAWGQEGEVPWEVQVRDGTAYLTSYWGEHYDLSAGTEALELRFARSADGRTWDQQVVYVGGASEAAFAFDGDGVLWADLRNEDGDTTGFGTLLCTAPAEDPFAWDCPDVSDPERHDSGRMLVHRGTPWLIGRYDVGGPYDQDRDDLTFEEQRLEYLTAYSGRPKRTALWSVHRDRREVLFDSELPSAGDTSFPSIVQIGEDRFLVANYTSPLDEPDIPWLQGQLSDRGTRIYLLEIEFLDLTD